jgi:hypothetical protein
MSGWGKSDEEKYYEEKLREYLHPKEIRYILTDVVTHQKECREYLQSLPFPPKSTSHNMTLISKVIDSPFNMIRNNFNGWGYSTNDILIGLNVIVKDYECENMQLRNTLNEYKKMIERQESLINKLLEKI